MTFPDGDSYVGDWADGDMNGWGAFYWNNGNSFQVLRDTPRRLLEINSLFVSLMSLYMTPISTSFKQNLKCQAVFFSKYPQKFFADNVPNFIWRYCV